MKLKKVALLFAFVLGSSLFLVAQKSKNENDIFKTVSRFNYNTPRDTLKSIINKMLPLKSTKENPYVEYWQAYAQYLLYFQEKANEKIALQAIETGMTILDDCKNKNSEHYALWALLKGIDVSYSSMVTVPFKSAANEKYAREAIESNPNNLRGYYSLAVKDYYTPTTYGGGKIVEENLLKAVALPDKADPNPYAPSWGKDDVYWYLVKFYDKAQKKDLAKKYLEEGLAMSPEHYGLNRMKKKLEK